MSPSSQTSATESCCANPNPLSVKVEAPMQHIPSALDAMASVAVQQQAMQQRAKTATTPTTPSSYYTFPPQPAAAIHIPNSENMSAPAIVQELHRQGAAMTFRRGSLTQLAPGQNRLGASAALLYEGGLPKLADANGTVRTVPPHGSLIRRSSFSQPIAIQTERRASLNSEKSSAPSSPTFASHEKPNASEQMSAESLQAYQDRKRRRRTSQWEQDILEREFSVHPLPSAEVRERLAAQLNMTPRAVQVWFQNKRQACKRRQSTSVSNLSHFGRPPIQHSYMNTQNPLQLPPLHLYLAEQRRHSMPAMVMTGSTVPPLMAGPAMNRMPMAPPMMRLNPSEIMHHPTQEVADFMNLAARSRSSSYGEVPDVQGLKWSAAMPAPLAQSYPMVQSTVAEESPAKLQAFVHVQTSSPTRLSHARLPSVPEVESRRVGQK